MAMKHHKGKGQKALTHAFAKGGAISSASESFARAERNREAGRMDSQHEYPAPGEGNNRPGAQRTRTDAKNEIAGREAARGPEDVFKHGNRDAVTRGMLDRDNTDRERNGGLPKGEDKPDAFKRGGKVMRKPC